MDKMEYDRWMQDSADRLVPGFSGSQSDHNM